MKAKYVINTIIITVTGPTNAQLNPLSVDSQHLNEKKVKKKHKR